MRLSLERQVEMGAMMPRFYGRAYYDWCRAYTVAYPIPLNWVVGVARRLWWWIVAGTAPSVLERRVELAVGDALKRERARQAGVCKNGYGCPYRREIDERFTAFYKLHNGLR